MDSDEEEGIMATDSDVELVDVLDEYERVNQTGGSIPYTVRFDLSEGRRKEVRRFNTTAVNYKSVVRENGSPRDLSDATNAFREGLQEALVSLFGTFDAQDFVTFFMRSNRMVNSVNLPMMRVGDLHSPGNAVDVILDTAVKVLNSNERFSLDDSFEINVQRTEMPGGTGPGRRLNPKTNLERYDKFLKRKKSVILIKNNDMMCCARAICVSKAFTDKDNEYRNVRSGFKVQETRAMALHDRAGVPYDTVCGINEMKKFQSVLPDYQLVCISADRCHGVLYKGEKRDKVISILYHDEHFDAITTLPGFFSTSYYCLDCEKGSREKTVESHRCKGKRCGSCYQFDCPDFGNALTVPCDKCNRKMKGPQCFNLHLTRNEKGGGASNYTDTICSSFKRCEHCGKYFRLKEGTFHRCGYGKCPSCKEQVELANHKCFVQPFVIPKRKRKETETDEDEYEEMDENAIDLTVESIPYVFVYFDIESRQETGVHVPNLLICQVSDRTDVVRFIGEGCVGDFLDFLAALEDELECDVIVVAHNMKGYDGYFVLNEYYKRYTIPELIMQGVKILSMSVGHVKFIDSLNFLQMPLAAFTTTFNLVEKKNGFFPHFFNTADNRNYVGPIPAREFFDPEGMSEKRRNEFEAWYDLQTEVYNFHEELVAYCESDVELLKLGCECFQMEFEKMIGFNPMRFHITMASACNAAYRFKFMPRNSIPIEPFNGWTCAPNINHSTVSLEWLEWENHLLRQTGVSGHIKHAGNDGEESFVEDMRKVFVDGFHSNSMTVFEFLGCWYHGCRKCFSNRYQSHPRHNNLSMEQVYENTMSRLERLRKLGLTVKTVWKCEWRDIKMKNEPCREFVKNLDLQSRLNPRDAFFGGRTNSICMGYQVDPNSGEKMLYYDFNSLYPSVNYSSRYPVGHPRIFTTIDHVNVGSFFGIAKVTVIPPRVLYFPVLPDRVGKKLLFHLCSTCARHEIEKPMLERSCKCTHSDKERQITGTWATPEILLAVEKGYKIVKIHEVWHFEESSTVLFKEYIALFLKGKQEASGWPAHANDDESKEAYIQDYFTKQGILLDKDKIAKNPGARSVNKYCLNTLWGKFGQRTNLTKCIQFTSPAKFFEFLTSEKVIVQHIQLVNDHIIKVYHTNREKDDETPTNICIFIAVFTTCYARLRLYEALDQLGRNVFYFDTDSVIFRWKEGEPLPECGDLLGQFKSEIEEPHYIEDFVAAGPKNYSYRVVDLGSACPVRQAGKQCKECGKQECHVRGFTLNARNSRLINFDSMKALISQDLEEPTENGVPHSIEVFNPHKIVRDKVNKLIKSEEQSKLYSAVVNKRAINLKAIYDDTELLNTFPYGFE